MAVRSEIERKRSNVSVVGGKQDGLVERASGECSGGGGICEEGGDKVRVDEYEGVQEGGGGV